MVLCVTVAILLLSSGSTSIIHLNLLHRIIRIYSVSAI